MQRHEARFECLWTRWGLRKFGYFWTSCTYFFAFVYNVGLDVEIIEAPITIRNSNWRIGEFNERTRDRMDCQSIWASPSVVLKKDWGGPRRADPLAHPRPAHNAAQRRTLQRTNYIDCASRFFALRETLACFQVTCVKPYPHVYFLRSRSRSRSSLAHTAFVKALRIPKAVSPSQTVAETGKELEDSEVDLVYPPVSYIVAGLDLRIELFS